MFTPDCRILQGDFCLELAGSRRGEPVLGLCKKKTQYQLWKYDMKVRFYCNVKSFVLSGLSGVVAFARLRIRQTARSIKSFNKLISHSGITN